MKILCLSHSERPFVGATTTVGAITARFAERQTVTCDNIESFDSVETAVPYKGAISFWQIDETTRTASYLTQYAPDFKVQSAVIQGDAVYICGSDRIEILDRDLQVTKTITHPLLAGPHTIALDGDGNIWVSSAPANAALCFCPTSGELLKAVPMPKSFGTGPDLSKDIDLREHYVPTNHQPTHLNCITPTPDGGFLATFWIQGAIYKHSPQGRWKEVISGFRGCHGGKICPDGNGLYFTDSSTGFVYYLDDKGRISGRTEFDSGWLHDAEMVNDRLVIGTAGDQNAIILADPQSGVVYSQHDCSRLGATVMFVNAYDVDEHWFESERTALAEATQEYEAGEHQPPQYGADEFLPPLHNMPDWSPQFDLVDAFPYRLISRRQLTSEYLLSCQPFTMWSGAYELSCNMDVRQGVLAIGVLDIDRDKWLLSKEVDPKHGRIRERIDLEEATRIKVVISAHNASGAHQIDALLYWISLRNVY